MPFGWHERPASSRWPGCCGPANCRPWPMRTRCRGPPHPSIDRRSAKPSTESGWRWPRPRRSIRCAAISARRRSSAAGGSSWRRRSTRSSRWVASAHRGWSSDRTNRSVARSPDACGRSWCPDGRGPSWSRWSTPRWCCWSITSWPPRRSPRASPRRLVPIPTRWCRPGSDRSAARCTEAPAEPPEPCSTQPTERAAQSAAVADALRMYGKCPGFGHAVYQHGDPRATALFDLLRTACGGTRAMSTVEGVMSAAQRRVPVAPNVDAALAALGHVTGMPVDGGEAMFAVARSIGWIAHALEEYQAPPLRFRPRARFTG